MKMNLNATDPVAEGIRRPADTCISHVRALPAVGRMNSSLRVPVSPRNWAYLRALREAEMAAWHRSQSEAGSAPATSLVRSVAAVSRPDLRERVLYAGVAAVALGAVSYGLWTSVQLSEHWAGFVHLVRQLVG